MFSNRTIVIATMHGKETVIAPLIEHALDARTMLCHNLDTDSFGTFTREKARIGNQAEAARLKALKALELTNETIAISSEGSFGPHPIMPFVQANIELVTLVDLKNELEIVGQAISAETNYAQQEVNQVEEAADFANKTGFPDHGLVIIYHRGDQQIIIKGIASWEELLQAINTAFTQSNDGRVHLETDMRAHYNPTRMKVIRLATLDLLKKLQSYCPSCQAPGYGIRDYIVGLPCAWCEFPTQRVKSVIYQCRKCLFQMCLPIGGNDKANPGDCLMCNP